MSKEEINKPTGTYYSVIDGTFRTGVDASHPDAITREWSTPDGKSGVKTERIVHALFGRIEGLELRDGDYGKNLNITLDPDEDGVPVIISLSVSSRYGEDVLKKLPNVELDEEVRFRPFSFKGKDDKDVRGIEITHKDEEGKFTRKVVNFFWDYTGEKTINGYPEPDEEDKKDWPFFYKKANKFLIKYLEEKVLPRFSGETKKDTVEYPEDLKAEDIPF